MCFFFILLQSANADTASYEFQVGIGNNTLNLEKEYNGSYINSISGTVYVSSLHYQEITINVTDAEKIGTKRTLKLNVSYTPGMRLDFSDVYFTDRQMNVIPFYIENTSIIEGSNATFYLYFESIAAENDLYICWGGGSNPKQDYFVFFNRINYPTGYTTSASSNFNVYSSDSLYGVGTSTTGIYTNSESIFSMSGSGSGHTSSPWLRLKANGTALPGTVSAWVESNKLVLLGGSLLTWTGILPNSSTVITLESSLLNSTLIASANNITSVKKIDTGIWTDVFSFYRGSGTFTLYSAKFYNSTNFTIGFGEIHRTEASEHPITISYPSTIFSTLNFTSDWIGLLELEVNYDPHVVLLTPDAANFTENVILQFQPLPETLSAFYQIALDESYYSMVRSGRSTGEIIEKLPPGTYFWRVQQPGGEWTPSRTFTINPDIIPGSLNFTIRNELTNATVSATVLISNETAALQKTGSTIIFNSSEVTAGNYTVRVNQTNYSTRHYEVASPGNYTFYVLPTNLTTSNVSVVYFSLIDNTNTFQYDSTKLEIIKQTENGSIVVQNSYFDASGFVVATLNQFDNYILKVVSDSGDERILGNYIQAGQSTVQLVVSEIILKENNSSFYGGFTYNLSKNETVVRLDWINPNSSLTESITFQIYKNNELMFNISTNAPFGSINYYDSVDGETKLDPDATYRIVFVAKTVDGTIRVNEFYRVNGESVGIDFDKIPTALRIVISFILLILIASLFNITNAKFSAIVVSLVAAFLAGIQFLPILPSVLIWLLFVAIVAYKTNNR